MKAHRLICARSGTVFNGRPPLIFFLSTIGDRMRPKKVAQLFHIELIYANNMTRTVKVMARSREVAEARALKRNPGAIGVKHG